MSKHDLKAHTVIHRVPDTPSVEGSGHEAASGVLKIPGEPSMGDKRQKSSPSKSQNAVAAPAVSPPVSPITKVVVEPAEPALTWRLIKPESLRIDMGQNMMHTIGRGYR